MALQIGGREIKKIEAFVAPVLLELLALKNLTLFLSANLVYGTALPWVSLVLWSMAEITEAAVREFDTRILMSKVRVVPVEGRKMLDAAVKVTFTDGSMVEADVPLSLGHPGNPMGWSELDSKFGRSVEPELGQKPYRFLIP